VDLTYTEPGEPVCSALRAALTRIAYNLRWTWQPSTTRLFASFAPDVWRLSHNPVAAINVVSSEALRAHRSDIEAADAELDEYLHAARPAGLPTVAYLCAEFALTECLPIYSGGLGVLAGDHLKAASDLGLPMLGIGLLYHQGYFRQVLDAAGRQHEQYDPLDLPQLPLRPVRDSNGGALHVSVPFPGRMVTAGVWLAQIGRVPLYLLDTNLNCNRDDDRWITAHLYGGDEDTRLRQEMTLGIGAARLLEALHIQPDVYHLNDGHAALLTVELARQALMEGSAYTFSEAFEKVATHAVFTTHTRLAAGHDTFPLQLVETYLTDYCASFSLSVHDLFRMARATTATAVFSMTTLALRGASQRNAVSPLHGVVSRAMWGDVGVGSRDSAPITRMTAITNGVHSSTWAGPEMTAMFDTYLGPRWRCATRERATWQPLQRVPPEVLWAARTTQRARLLARVERDVDPQGVLVVGFARRFTEYKRANLLLRDLGALARLVSTNRERQVLIVFSGKAHPRDEGGKLLVQQVVDATRDGRFAGRLVFLADYDLELARLLVQGSDVWLNTPRRSKEASGTSGMKAVLNGALHLSELDGWWDEAYEPGLGWALGLDLADELSDEARDEAEARELLTMLHDEIVPLFFSRDASNTPLRWLEHVTRSICALAPAYSAERMLLQYVERLYVRSGLGQATSGNGKVLSSAGH
jgi:starch phosphorylase